MISFVLIADRNVCFVVFFFFIVPATTEIYTLSLHDALPISWPHRSARCSIARPSSRPTLSESQPKDRKSTRLNSSHVEISYAVFCLKKKKNKYFATYAVQKNK